MSVTSSLYHYNLQDAHCLKLKKKNFQKEKKRYHVSAQLSCHLFNIYNKTQRIEAIEGLIILSMSQNQTSTFSNISIWIYFVFQFF